jgi:hypothetical protein
MRRSASVCIAAVALLATAPPAGAATFSPPIELGEMTGLGPIVRVDDKGAAYVVTNLGDDLVLTTVAGAEPTRRTYPLGPIGGVAFDVAPSGAQVLAWQSVLAPRTTTGRITIASARPGRAVRLPGTIVEPSGGTLTDAGIGAGGAIAVMWIRTTGRRSSLRTAVGRSGSDTGQSQILAPVTTVLQTAEADVNFLSGGRPLWTWLAVSPAPGEPKRLVRQRYAATRPGAKPQVVDPARRKGERSTPEGIIPLTDGRGSQLNAWSEGTRLGYMTRAPGRPYGKPRTIGTEIDGDPVGAMNAAGDAVLAWHTRRDRGQQVIAVVRRRDGRIAGPQRVSAGDPRATADDPAVAIDPAGRAVVAWRAFDEHPSQLFPAEVRVATATRSGRFGESAIVSGPTLQLVEDAPRVAVGGDGSIAVGWRRGSGRRFAVLARGRF